jgi:hypothetical protein
VAVETVRFDFLGVFRPAVILGNSNTPSVLAHVMPLLHWAMPSKYHSIHKNDLARAMVAQSEQVFRAIAQGSPVPSEPTIYLYPSRRSLRFRYGNTTTERPVFQSCGHGETDEDILTRNSRRGSKFVRKTRQ